MSGKEKNSHRLHCIKGIPDKTDIQTILSLYSDIFQDAVSEFFLNRIQTKNDLLSILAFSNEKPVGFKIGYRYDLSTFYSWIGGVLPTYRQQGIATAMAQKQEAWVRQKDYSKLRTKSMNQYKPMMILNLKNGFDIIQIYTNQSRQTKLVFEKNL